MIDSITIEHWHRSSNTQIELNFFYKDVEKKLHVRRHVPTETSLRRFMSLVWERVLHGEWSMLPSSAGSKNHWSYSVWLEKRLC